MILEINLQPKFTHGNVLLWTVARRKEIGCVSQSAAESQESDGEREWPGVGLAHSDVRSNECLLHNEA